MDGYNYRLDGWMDGWTECVMYLGCCLKADCAVAAVDVCLLPVQNPDSNSVAGPPEKDGGPPRLVILWQSSSVQGPYRVHAPGASASRGYSFQVHPPEEEPVCGSANRDCENQWRHRCIHKQPHAKRHCT